MRILLVGADLGSIQLLEVIKVLPGVRFLGIVDKLRDPDCRKLGRVLSLPVLTSEALQYGETPDVILHLDDRIPLATLPSGTVSIFKGYGLKLLELLGTGTPERTMEDDATNRQVGQQTSCDSMIIGKSPQIQHVLELFAQVAATPTSVLLLGETGTGKDLAASCIHLSSHLRKKSFVAVNCTALTPSLMESELFGYVKGAFTGAEKDRKGLLEEADQGTLFLDEIGDMPIELQAKLLRFLQTGEARRVGSTQARNLNVRIIAATNRDLQMAMEQGEFRADLFYRFSTFTVTMPPLRERAVDIPYLAYHFLTKAEEKLNKRVKTFSNAALEAFSSYDWPGNVRELKNIIERAVILCKGDTIELEHLPSQMAQGGQIHSPPDLQSSPTAFLATDRERVIANFEKKELQQYLKKAGGNVSKASRLSGVPRRTFYRKMQKYGL